MTVTTSILPGDNETVSVEVSPHGAHINLCHEWKAAAGPMHSNLNLTPPQAVRLARMLLEAAVPLLSSGELGEGREPAVPVSRNIVSLRGPEFKVFPRSGAWPCSSSPRRRRPTSAARRRRRWLWLCSREPRGNESGGVISVAPTAESNKDVLYRRTGQGCAESFGTRWLPNSASSTQGWPQRSEVAVRHSSSSRRATGPSLGCVPGVGAGQGPRNVWASARKHGMPKRDVWECEKWANASRTLRRPCSASVPNI